MPNDNEDIERMAHSLDEQELYSMLGSRKDGLLPIQARQALEVYGPNTWSVQQKVTWIQLLLRQVQNLLILMLIASAAVAWLADHPYDAIGILAAVLLSIFFGFFQEYKAEQALGALQKMTAPKANVLRNGKEAEINAGEIVPGDILVLREGSLITADARIVEGDLACDQSVLTGESVPANKTPCIMREQTPMAERKNCIYAGTLVVRGQGRAIVFATGLLTRFGKIAKDISEVQSEQTPLQKHLTGLGQQIGIVAIILAVIFFIWGLARGENLIEILLIAVTMAVAAIPEGLPTVLAITLAIGVQRMAKDKALVRRMQAVEALGAATVICTDKTGTLTANRMEAVRMNVAGQDYSLSGGPLESEGRISRLDGRTLTKTDSELAHKLLMAGALCNDARLVFNSMKLIDAARGDPTEVALLVAAEKAKIDTEAIRSAWKVDSQIPFEYSRKMMSQVRRLQQKRVSYVKGAPEVVLEHCTHVLTQGGVKKLTPPAKRRIRQECEGYAKDALRTIGVAQKDMKPKARAHEAESGLTWIGVMGLIDPPRPEVKDALGLCQQAGIRVIMLTGDSPHTARRIAQDLGLSADESGYITGAEINNLTDRQLLVRVRTMVVCARATPEHKFRIIRALQAEGEIVAVTGDGVNDAPSIKRADIGVAMGEGGTDVARGASDIVLIDNNFRTLVKAIERGRSIFENIRAFVRFQFTTNIAALTLMFAAPFVWLPIPLKPLQILWINIIMDGPPALALGLEPGRADAMSLPPRDPKAPFLDRHLIISILSSGLLMFALTIAIFGWYVHDDPYKAGTVVFTLFVFLQLVNAFSCRSFTLSALDKPFANKYLLIAVLISVTLHMAIIYVPYFEGIFDTVPLNIVDWLVVFVASWLMLFMEEVRKLLAAKVRQKKD